MSSFDKNSNLSVIAVLDTAMTVNLQNSKLNLLFSKPPDEFLFVVDAGFFVDA